MTLWNTTTLRQRLKAKSKTTTTTEESTPTDSAPLPKPVPKYENDETDSVTSNTNNRRDWSSPYNCPSTIDARLVYGIGLFVFLLAMIWPPLILLVTYILGKLLPYSIRENDAAHVRRKLFMEFVEHAEDLPDRFVNINNYVAFSEGYWTNARGMALYHSVMTPRNRDTVAVVCFCHGYTDHSSYAKRIEYQRLCEAGIAVISIEYEGHGRSDGTLGLINCWETMVGDVTAFFSERLLDFPNKPAFLMGESMGGAVAYCVYNRIPQVFSGVIFVAPMCKIAPEMLPPQFVITALKTLIGKAGEDSILSFLPIAPAQQSLSDIVNKCPEKGRNNSRCPVSFGRNPRLGTARELIDVTQRITDSLHKFSAPMLILHGTADRVTDPALSEALYRESCSTDKTLRLYEDMWHGLTAGEPDENIQRVFGDVVEWVLERV